MSRKVVRTVALACSPLLLMAGCVALDVGGFVLRYGCADEDDRRAAALAELDILDAAPAGAKPARNG